MLKNEEAKALFRRQENLTCTNPEAAREMFFFVLKGEPEEKRLRYMSHIENCSYCQIQIDLFRYKRDAMRLVAEGAKQGTKFQPVPPEERRPLVLTPEERADVDELEREYRAIVAEEEAEESKKAEVKKK